MKLLTEELRKQLPPLYSQEQVKDPMVLVKFFHPMSSMTWYGNCSDLAQGSFGGQQSETLLERIETLSHPGAKEASKSHAGL
jgi:hypothetical protein